MEFQKRLSSCWESFLGCFKKPNQPVAKTRGDNDLVIGNPEFDGRDEPTPLAPAIPGVYYIAQYNYSARTEEDLSFHAGDTLEALDKSHGDWWLAKALTGVSASHQGYIPANYVAPLESVDAEA